MSVSLFGCQNHFKASENNIREYDNGTRVADYHCTPNPAGIAPYTRPNNAPDPCSGESPDCTCDHPKCGPWPVAERGALDVDGPTSQNLFLEVDLFANLARCRKLGFKNVQAKKSWHGRFGYDYIDGVSAPAGAAGSGCTCSVECEHTTTPENKYCSIDATSTYTVSSDDTPVTLATATAHRAFSVGKTTGVASLTSCSDTYSNEDPDGDPDEALPNAIASLTIADWSLQTIVTRYLSEATMPSTDIVETISECGLKRDKEWVANGFPGVADGTVLKEAHLNVSGGHLGIKKYNVIDLSVEWELAVDWTETTLVYDLLNPGIGSGSASATHTHVEATLGSLYTFSAVWAQLVALASYIDLTNDILSPWRTDAFTTIAQLVSYAEKDPVAPSTAFGDCSYVDADAALYDGSIRGIPDVRALKDGWFDYDHIVWQACLDAGVGCVWSIYGYGEWSGSSVVPKTSTQWTNKHDACGLSHGAFVSMTGLQGDHAQAGASDVPVGWAHGAGVVVLQKWAEIKQPFHRFNSSRPCGADKSILDETTVRCVTGVSGSTLTLGEAPAASYVTVGVSGVAGFVDGIYSMASGSGTSWVLGSLVEARSFPDGPSVIGEIKYPSAGDCTGDFYLPSAGKVVHCEWQFNFRDYQERKRYNDEVAACVCSGLSAGTPIRENQALWQMPQSVAGFSQWQHVLTPSACYPSVICISPNGESWPGGVTVDFSTCPFPAAGDMRYGSLWQAEVIQILSDPYWQTPRQCNELGHTEPIEVSCPPVIEAELGPTPPLGWLTLEELDVGSAPDGNVLPPPNVAGYNFGCTPNPKETPGLPWTRYFAGCDDNGKTAWTAP